MGKGHEKAIRGTYKITAQALWQVLLPQLLDHIQNKDQTLSKEIEEARYKLIT